MQTRKPVAGGRAQRITADVNASACKLYDKMAAATRWVSDDL